MSNNSKRIITALIATSLLLGVACKKSDATNQKSTVAYSISKEDIEITKHVVKKGESLSRISKKYYGVTSYWRELATFNEISNPDVIRVGQVIKVPNKVEDLLAYLYLFTEDTEKTYVVQKGDTLSEICTRFYNASGKSVTWRLATYNKLYDPDYIVTGQRLLIPDYETLMEVDPIDYVKCYPEPKEHHRCDEPKGKARTLKPHTH